MIVTFLVTLYFCLEYCLQKHLYIFYFFTLFLFTATFLRAKVILVLRVFLSCKVPVVVCVSCIVWFLLCIFMCRLRPISKRNMKPMEVQRWHRWWSCTTRLLRAMSYMCYHDRRELELEMLSPWLIFSITYDYNITSQNTHEQNLLFIQIHGTDIHMQCKELSECEI